MLANRKLLLMIVAGLAWPTIVLSQDLPEGGEVLPESGRTISKVEEIVVQARKRTELIEDTPISVSAISEFTMNEIGAFRLDDVTQLVPNLTLVTGRSDNQAAIFVRGIGNSTTEIAFDPGVGVYVDGVYLPRAFGSIINIVDIEQIEVLRGPQGTLFGKNTVGGAINVTTIKPSNEFEGTAAIWVGNLETFNSRATLNVPILEDTLAVRVAIGTTYDSGYAYNTFLDRPRSNEGSTTFLGSLRYTPTDRLTIDVSGSWARNHSNGLAGECLIIQESGLAGADLWEACRETTPREVTSNFPGLADITSTGAWATVQYDVGSLGFLDDITLKSITSARRQVARIADDLDQTYIPRVAFAHAGGSPTMGRPNDQRQIQQELQFNGNAWDDRVQFVSGAFFFFEKATDNTSTTSDLPPGLPDSIRGNGTEIRNFTWALFGQASVDVIRDWLSLTAGLRYTQDQKNADKLAFQFISEDSFDYDITAQQSEGATFDAWTPMASLAVTLPQDLIANGPLDHLMGYFTYSRGFKGGGFNATLSGASEEFQPEYLDSFEIGAKSILFEQRLIANISAFYGNYDDLQVTTFITDPLDPLIVQRVTLNAAEATTKGIEIELTAVPIDGLLLRGTTGILDAKYDEFIGVNSINSGPIDRAGEFFNYVPRHQAYLSAQYSIPVEGLGPSWLEGALTPRLSWTYRGGVNFNGPELPQARQESYGLIDARIAYEFLDGKASVALWGHNLTDQEYFTQTNALVPIFGLMTRFYGPPRTYGGEIRYSF